MTGTVLDVEPLDFVTSSDSAATAARAAAAAGARLLSALGSSSHMAGSDPAGLKWAEQYDKVAADAIAGLDSIETAFGQVSAGLAVSGLNYATADWLSSGRSGHAPGFTVPSLPGPTCSAPPASAAGGSRTSPIPGFEYVANFIGEMWPDGDTGKLRAAGSAWSAFADDLQAIHSGDVSRIQSGLDGTQTPEMPAIRQTITTVGTGAGRLADEARNLSQACSDLADQIEKVHQQTEQVLNELVEQLAATALIGVGLTIVTAGISDAAGALAAGGEIAVAVSRILSFIAELGTSVGRVVDTIATSAGSIAKVAGISEQITIRVVTIAGRSVVTGVGGAFTNVGVAEITDPGADILTAAEQGFIGGAAFGGLATGAKMAGTAMGARDAAYEASTAGRMAKAEKTLAGTAKTFSNDGSAARWGASKWNKTALGLPEPNRAALFDYTSDPPHTPSYVEFNNSLRGLSGGSPQLSHEVDLIDQALTVKPVPKDVMVARGTNLGHIPVDPPDMVGATYSDKAFMSTSLGRAAFKDMEAVLNLRVPAGTPAMYLEKVSAFHGAERELLLGRGLSYRVSDVIFDESKNQWQIYAEVTK